MSKIRLTSYTFDASAQTVVASEFSDVGLSGIQLITNVTDQIVIYNFADTAKGGTLSTDTLTLEFDTTSMSDTDELMILVEDGLTPLTSGLAKEAGGNLETINTNVDSSATSLTAIAGDTSSIAASLTDPATETTLAAAAASLATLDNIVAGSEAQVDIVGPLPAGTSNIGDVDIASIAAGNNNIGDVDVATLPVAFNSGNVSATTQRVVLATDVALPAGTNAIGKLSANSGVDIGDVDVTSVPRSLSGPGQPGTAIDSYTHAAFNLAAGADQVLVSSAPSKQIWVYGIGFTVNVAGTVSFQDEDNTAITGVMPMAATGGMVVSPSGNFSMPIWKLATDKDLEVDVVTSELDGWIDYAIVSI